MVVAAHVSPVSPGDTLAGRYRVERIIGIGGMGVVVAARHLELDHLVAIKFLLPKVAENRDIVGRFTREARAAVRIQNDHVARVTDVGTLESGAPYMVMEYLDGTDLEDFTRKSGPLSIEEAIDFLLQACEAIAEAHGLGIVHRDLKPGNLFLVKRPDGSRIVKVLDFGISKVTGGNNSVAPTTAMLGSPPFMSPEQLTTPRDVDLRTDIWSLGVILYRLLTGRVPFDAETIVQLCSMIMHGDPPPIREARADVPPGLEAIIATCLRKDRTKRYANVGDFAQALLEFAPERSRVSIERVLHLTAAQVPAADTVLGKKRARRSSEPQIVPLTPAIETNSGWGQTARSAKKRSRRGVRVVMGAIVLGAGAFGAWHFNLIPGGPRPVATASAPIPAPVAATESTKAEPQPTEPSKPLAAAPSQAPVLNEPAPHEAPGPLASTTAPSRTVAKPRPRPAPAAGQEAQSRTKGGSWEEQRK
jgi:serine/threonine-protein kinase